MFEGSTFDINVQRTWPRPQARARTQKVGAALGPDAASLLVFWPLGLLPSGHFYFCLALRLRFCFKFRWLSQLTCEYAFAFGLTVPLNLDL